MGRILVFINLFLVLATSSVARAERFVEITAEIQAITHGFNGSDDTGEMRREISLVCIVGTNEWRIENNFPPNSEVKWHFDGTNIYQSVFLIKQASQETRDKIKRIGPAVVPFELARSNITIKVDASSDGCPLGNAGVNIPWLAFCSGAYLKRPGRIIPLPIANLRHAPDAFGYFDETELFSDELGLPRSVILRTSKSHYDASAREFNQRRYGSNDGAGVKHNAPSIKDGSLKFQYSVLASTNFLGWSIPLQFEFLQNEAGPGGTWVRLYSGSGKVTSIRPGSRPEAVFAPSLHQTVVDYRFQNDAKKVDAFVYKWTNAYAAPANDPALRKRFAERVERSPQSTPRGDIRSRGRWAAGIAVCLLIMPLMLLMIFRQNRKQTYNTMILLLAFVFAGTARASDGYEVIGHFTFIRFDAGENAVYKNVRMFNLRVDGVKWHIRTEPVVGVEGGVGFYEAWSGADQTVLMVTAFEGAYASDESPFQSLRAELKAAIAEDVFFANAPSASASLLSSGFVPPGYSEKALPTERMTNHVNNVAVATALKSRHPPANPSYAAFLWFAFTPPSPKRDGAKDLLLQIWDDGNPKVPRFRQARWDIFASPPHLVSRAIYDWAGIQVLPSGAREKIRISDVSHPPVLAARYDVRRTTNFNGLTLPLEFELTRFATKHSASGERGISSTIVASVVEVRRLSDEKALDGAVPGRTFVSDYRISAGELRGVPLGYLIESNSPPPIEDVRDNILFRRHAARVHQATSSPLLARWVLMCLLCLVPLAWLCRTLFFRKPNRPG